MTTINEFFVELLKDPSYRRYVSTTSMYQQCPSVYLNIDITKDVYDIPIGIRHNLSTCISGEFTNLALVYSAFHTNYRRNPALSTAVIEGMLSGYNDNIDRRLTKVKAKGDYIFYAGEGILLDRNLKPLFFIMERYERVVNNGVVSAKLRSIVAKVDSRVFKDAEEPLNKYIRTKVLPTMFTCVTEVRTSAIYRLALTSTPSIEAEVCDLSYMFNERPAVVRECTPENIGETLLQHEYLFR